MAKWPDHTHEECIFVYGCPLSIYWLRNSFHFYRMAIWPSPGHVFLEWWVWEWLIICIYLLLSNLSFSNSSQQKYIDQSRTLFYCTSSVGNSLGTNSSMFANCSFFWDVWHVRSSVLGQNVMFGRVRSSGLLLCDQTSLGTYSLMFANCSVFCDVRHVRSSILG